MGSGLRKEGENGSSHFGSHKTQAELNISLYHFMLTFSSPLTSSVGAYALMQLLAYSDL